MAPPFSLDDEHFAGREAIRDQLGPVFGDDDHVLNVPRLLLLRRNFLSRQLFDSACKMSHVNPKVLLESNNAQALLALAKVGQGIAILPSTVKLENVRQKVIPIWHNQKPIGMWMSAIWDPRRYLTPAAKIFIEETYQFTRKEFPGQKVRGVAAAIGQPRPHPAHRRTSPA